jgi:KDO2-lipid IV(A) lauroyltransferase
MSAFPERWAERFGAALGFLAGTVLRLRRGIAARNLALALAAERDEKEQRRVLRAMYRHLGWCLAEFLRLSTWTPRKIAGRITLDGFDRLQAAIASGRGVVVVTAHFGNWDLLACLSARLGVPLHVVTRDLKGGRTNRSWMRMRAQMGVHLHPALGSGGALLSALRRGEVVAFVIDQHMPPKLGVSVPFFGRPASTTDAPAVLAARTGAAVLPAFLFREGFERHRLWVGPEIPLSAGPRKEATRESTARFSQAVEEVVRAHPEQWIWLHRRWKIAESPGGEPRLAQESSR